MSEWVNSFDDWSADLADDAWRGSSSGSVSVDVVERYGVFVWSAGNRYPECDAIRVYGRVGDADRFADSNRGLNYVVRTVTQVSA